MKHAASRTQVRVSCGNRSWPRPQEQDRTSEVRRRVCASLSELPVNLAELTSLIGQDKELASALMMLAYGERVEGGTPNLESAILAVDRGALYRLASMGLRSAESR